MYVQDRVFVQSNHLRLMTALSVDLSKWPFFGEREARPIHCSVIPSFVYDAFIWRGEQTRSRVFVSSSSSRNNRNISCIHPSPIVAITFLIKFFLCTYLYLIRDLVRDWNLIPRL